MGKHLFETEDGKMDTEKYLNYRRPTCKIVPEKRGDNEEWAYEFEYMNPKVMENSFFGDV